MLKEHPNSVIFSKPGTQNARVTVCISLYNYQDYVTETLESVKAQTIDILDLIVIEDCSTDNSMFVAKTWIKEHASRFNKVELIRHDSNAGLARARNTALCRVETPYVFILDADNLLYPRCIERLFETLENDLNAAMAYPIIEKFGTEVAIMGNVVWEQSRFLKENCVDAMSLIRLEILKNMNGYSIMDVSGWEDYELWCRFFDSNFYGILVPEILARYRTHKLSMLNTVSNKHENVEQLHTEMTNLHPWLNLLISK